uniref:Sel1 repeat family protein n=1 Tax=Rhabditophanes sp. KR3021 TaxID=114890 RepID=A0AC35TZ67_9BILA
MDKLTREEFEAIQKEREEYVKNIGIEYRYGCYEEKRPDSCHFLAEWQESIKQDLEKAYDLFKSNCLNSKYGRSCYKYGNYRIAGVFEKPDSLADLISPFKIACDSGIGPGCRMVGLIYWNGDEQRKADSKKAVQYLEKACGQEDTISCMHLSNWFRASEEERKRELSKNQDTYQGTIPKNASKALEYAVKACDLGDSGGCFHVSLMYKGKDGFPKDDVKKKEYFQKANEIVKMKTAQNANAGFTGQ